MTEKYMHVLPLAIWAVYQQIVFVGYAIMPKTEDEKQNKQNKRLTILYGISTFFCYASLIFILNYYS